MLKNDGYKEDYAGMGSNTTLKHISARQWSISSRFGTVAKKCNNFLRTKYSIIPAARKPVRSKFSRKSSSDCQKD